MQGIDALYFTDILNGYCGRLAVDSGTLWLYEGDTFRTSPMISMVLWSSVSPYAIWFIGGLQDV